MSWIIYLIIGLTVSVTFNVISSILLYRLGKVIIGFEDTVEASVPVIQKAENVLSSILSKPLFYDSPEVKEAVNSIRSVRYAILTIATNFNIVEEEETSESTS